MKNDIERLWGMHGLWAGKRAKDPKSLDANARTHARTHAGPGNTSFTSPLFSQTNSKTAIWAVSRATHPVIVQILQRASANNAPNNQANNQANNPPNYKELQLQLQL